jgi:AcrR family transcriptional regulator
MGTKERRQREVAEREQLFIDKARDLVCQEGLLQLQMARLADECDYATGTLYQHFGSKEDLVVALLTDRVEQRSELFRRAAEWDARPRDRIFAVAAADTLFVQRNPEYFRIAQLALTEVVWSAASVARRHEYLAKMKPIGDIVVGIVRDGVAAGDLELEGGATVEEAALGVWTLVCGTHNLVHAEGFLESFEVREPYRLMGRNIHRLLNGLEWRPLFDVADAEAYDRYWERLSNELFSTEDERAERVGAAMATATA